MTRTHSISRVAAALLICWASAAAARDDRFKGEQDQDYAHRLRTQGAIVSLASVIDQAQGVHSGDLLEAELKDHHGRQIYEVEILDPEGRVWEMQFDARSGQLIKLKREREEE